MQPFGKIKDLSLALAIVTEVGVFSLSEGAYWSKHS